MPIDHLFDKIDVEEGYRKKGIEAEVSQSARDDGGRRNG